jgi:hypothetical protein
MNNFYVYAYLDPRKSFNFKYGKYEFNYEPFYIGKGFRKDRMVTHLQENHLDNDGNKFKTNKIKKIIRETGNNPIIIKIKEDLMEFEANKLEIDLIKLIGRKDLKLGPLTNMTDGGEGQTGWKPNQEWINNRKKYMKENNPSFKKEVREKQSKSAIEGWKDKNRKEIQSKIRIDKKLSAGINNPNSKYIWKFENLETCEIFDNINSMVIFCKAHGIKCGSISYSIINTNGRYKNWIITRRLRI